MPRQGLVQPPDARDGMRPRAGFMAGLVAFSAAVFLVPQAQAASRLPPDQPQRLGGSEVVCTGVGQDARADPRWAAFPLKIEMAGRDGQFLGDSSVTLSPDGAGIAADIAKVSCDGPWLLFRVPPGRYRIEAEIEGQIATSKALVPTSGQARIIMRFPGLGGQVSPQAKTAGTHE